MWTLRPCSYGHQLPTPEDIRKDKDVAWEHLEICNGPKTTPVRYKRIAQAKWHAAGENAVVQVVVIAPLSSPPHRQYWPFLALLDRLLQIVGHFA